METNNPAVMTGAVRDHARTIEHKPWFNLAARAGLASRAVIYALLAYFAFDIALHGHAPAQANGTGALTDLDCQPGGPVLLATLGVGLFAYGAWRMVLALGGTSTRGGDSAATRIGQLVIAAVYFTLFVQAMSLIAGSGTTGAGPTSQPGPFVARALRWPGGPELVAITAVGIICGGIALALWAFLHDFDKVFEAARIDAGTRFCARATQQFGDTTRGALVALTGIYGLVAAVTNDPSHVKSLGQVLQTVAHQTYGTWLIVMAASGLLSFSVSSGFEAVYRRV